MKKLFPVIVTTRRIEAPTEQFDATEIEALAESCLELGGFINPPVLRRDGENYTIVSGHKQVAAALRALEIDSTVGSMLPVFIVEEKTEAAIMTQLEITPSNAPSAPEPTATETPATPAPAAQAPQTPTSPATSTIAALEKAFSLHRLALTFGQLKQLATAKGIKVTGDRRKKQSYIDALTLALG